MRRRTIIYCVTFVSAVVGLTLGVACAGEAQSNGVAYGNYRRILVDSVYGVACYGNPSLNSAALSCVRYRQP